MHHSAKFVSFIHTMHHFTRKLAVFDTILGSSPARCGTYIKLIQFYSLIHCNTNSYNASFFKVCIVQPHKASFYPQTRRFRYNFRFKSCPLGIDPNFNRSLFLGYILCFGVHILFLTFQPSNGFLLSASSSG